MTPADGKEFSDLLNGTMVDIYQREPLSPAGISVWWNILKEFGLQDFRSALAGHLQDTDTGQYPPKPSDVLKRLKGTGDSRAFGAWAKTLLAIQTVGSYRSVVFDDPLIHSVVDDMGGWIALGKIKTDELPFRAIEFQKRYRALIINPPESHPARLGGITSLENGRDARAVEPPVYIGDPARAALVQQRGADRRLQITSAADIGSAVMALIKGN